MTALREAVARAICSAEGLDWDLQSGLGSGNGDEQAQEAYLMLADAAIAAVFAALREPTEEMWVAGRDPILMWQAGIQASLKEAGPFDWYKEGDGETKGDCAVWVWRAMLTTAERAAAAGKGE